MSFSDESSSDSNSDIKYSRSKTLKTKQKYYPRHFLESWLVTFKSWICRDPANPNKPFCRVCKTQLNCNTSHLKRHSRTAKHKAHLEANLHGGDINELKLKYSKNMKSERQKGDIDEKKAPAKPYAFPNDDITEENKIVAESSEHNQVEQPQFQFVPTDAEGNIDYENRNSTGSCAPHIKRDSKKKPLKIRDRSSLLKRIHKDRIDLFDSYATLSSQKPLLRPSPSKEKDHVDLFFESVVMSVKCLSPKLISEAKLRVSQMIGELELREITAKEAASVQFTVDSPSNVACNEGANRAGSYFVSHLIVDGNGEGSSSHGTHS